jgi:hypothetical protein
MACVLVCVSVCFFWGGGRATFLACYFLRVNYSASSSSSSSPLMHWKSPEADLTKLVNVMLFSEQSLACSEICLTRWCGQLKQAEEDTSC